MKSLKWDVAVVVSNSMGPFTGSLGKSFSPLDAKKLLSYWSSDSQRGEKLRVGFQGSSQEGLPFCNPVVSESAKYGYRRYSFVHQLQFQSIHGILQNSIMPLKGGPGGAVTDYLPF